MGTRGASLDYVTVEDLTHCVVCGSPLLPGDNAMRERGTEEFRHYGTSPSCTVTRRAQP